MNGHPWFGTFQYSNTIISRKKEDKRKSNRKLSTMLKQPPCNMSLKEIWEFSKINRAEATG